MLEGFVTLAVCSGQNTNSIDRKKSGFDELFSQNVPRWNHEDPNTLKSAAVSFILFPTRQLPLEFLLLYCQLRERDPTTNYAFVFHLQRALNEPVVLPKLLCKLTGDV